MTAYQFFSIKKNVQAKIAI